MMFEKNVPEKMPHGYGMIGSGGGGGAISGPGAECRPGIAPCEQSPCEQLIDLLQRKNILAEDHKNVFRDYMEKQEQLKGIQNELASIDKLMQEAAPRFDKSTEVNFI